MKKYLKVLFLVVIVAVSLGNCFVYATPAVSARCGILMDAATGRVLWECRPDEKSLVASTTKIMTGLLIAENCDPEARVAVSDDALNIEGSSIYLQQDEVLTVRELLYGMMLHSGNDAAAALAIYDSGSTEEFAKKMNRRAEELGLFHTHFANPHGLDDAANYSTARDLAVLAAEAMKNHFFAEIVSTKTACVGSRSYTNHNKLLWRCHGATGVKTGYTKSAGRILVSSCCRDGRNLICVTINAPNDWADHCNLYDYGFEAFQQKELLRADSVLAEIPVLCGAEDTVQAVPGVPLFYPVGEDEKISYRLDLPALVFAPVLAGDTAGRLVLLIDGKAVMEVPVFWRYSVLEGA